MLLLVGNSSLLALAAGCTVGPCVMQLGGVAAAYCVDVHVFPAVLLSILPRVVLASPSSAGLASVLSFCV